MSYGVTDWLGERIALRVGMRELSRVGRVFAAAGV